jgi:signal transduction histidine kinase
MQTKVKRKIGIRLKFMLFICLAILIIMAIRFFLTYFYGFTALEDNIGYNYAQMAQLLASHISSSFRDEIEDIRTYAIRPLWLDFAEQSNLKYKGMNNEAMQRYFKDMDKAWLEARENSPLLNEYLKNRVGISMQDIKNVRKTTAELFITDKFGGLVASSNKTTDFYQADEAWWREAYNGGKGKIYAGDIELDASSGCWVIPIAVAMKNENNEVVGVCKEGLSLERILSQLETFKIGKTGHAALVDDNGYVLFHKGIASVKQLYFRNEDFQKILESKKPYATVTAAHMHPEKIFIVFTKVELPFLSKAGSGFLLLIEQDAAEALAPLNKYIFGVILSTIIVFMIMVPIAYIFGSIFVRPIHKLHLATERVMAGDWDYKIEIKTGDEIEQFADTFKQMISNMDRQQREITAARSKAENSALDLENKVRERTKELTQVQEASLNILEDLTEAKKQLESSSRKLEESSKIKSDFTSMVSHELRTPLAAIKEGVGLVLEETAGELNKDQKNFLEIAKRNIDRLTRLINDVLDFQKLESGRIVFNMAQNNINETVKEVYNTMISLAKEKGLVLAHELSANLPEVKFDRDKIMQVLSNLISNAIKATEKGSITVCTQRQGSDILVSVKDSGPGIKKEDMAILFQRFVQLGSADSRKPGGTGLGLAISKEIIQAHQGKIWIESEPAKGATFYFTLPLAPL